MVFPAPLGPTSATSRWFSRRYRPISRPWFPNTLASSTPDTDSVSSLLALIAATASCVDTDTRRRRSPTAIVSHNNTGTVMTAAIVAAS